MTPDTRDTIVATASAHAAGARGVVRLAGPDALAIASRLCGQPISPASPQRLAGLSATIDVAGYVRPLPCDLCVWPDERSYTRQPAVELHTVGSPPLLDAVVRVCVAAGARLAEPGEFTLRAFLAGRLDLTQAEAVLAVIDARHTTLLEPALAQLAGGLSGPLHRLRAGLLDLLADLEAGLDFVEEEDVRFVEPEELLRRLREAQSTVAEAQRQTETRAVGAVRPRVAIVGPPNVGKSRLFNALHQKFGERFGDLSTEALVADQAGVTRDALTAPVRLGGVECDLVDTAGDDQTAAIDPIDAVARGRVAGLREGCDLLLECAPLASAEAESNDSAAGTLRVATMADRVDQAERPSPPSGWLVTSASEGTGLDELSEAVAARLTDAAIVGAAGAVAHTAERCAASLAAARQSLERAAETAVATAGDELVSLELREALDALGRVVGAVVTDDILDQVFGKFCIGK